LEGQRVAVMRRRNSASSSSGTLTRNTSVVVLDSATGDLLYSGYVRYCARVEVVASPARHDLRDLYAEAAWPSAATHICQ
jgi:hypothetical protein